MRAILKRLIGVDRRSIGKSKEVVAEVLANPKLFGIVFEGMLNDDPVLRMRCVGVVEKITVEHPEYLRPFKEKLIQLQELTRTGSPAMQTRGKKLLIKLITRNSGLERSSP